MIPNQAPPPADAGEFTLAPLLSEILSALGELVAGGSRHSIDLRNLPFGPGERDRLTEFLGQGEVTARLDSLGHSDFIETRFAGVWRIEHYDAEDRLVGDLIEIAEIPQLLLPPVDDLGEGRDALIKAIAKRTLTDTNSTGADKLNTPPTTL